METELVLASSPEDAGISCWDFRSGAEHTRFRSCSTPPHGLATVGGRVIAAAQVRESKSSSSSSSVLYWSWNKPQPEVKSFPAEPIYALASNSEGTYIVGGGVSGYIFLWEVATGKLLKKWHAHYRAVTCLVFSDDQSLLVSGSEDGSVRVWSLFMIFDDERRERANHIYEYSFSEHTLKVTDIVIGYGGSNAVIVSSSEDRTCKIWSLSRGKLLRDIVFPSVIDAVVLDPGENVFYAGGRDGKIYIAALTAQVKPSNKYGKHVIGSFSEQSKAITCLALSMDGCLLISGSEDGMIRVWDTKSHNIMRVFRHSKGPINNIIVIRQPPHLNPRSSMTSQPNSSRRHATFPLPLEKYSDSSQEYGDIKAFLHSQTTASGPADDLYVSCQMMQKQLKELQQQGSSEANKMDLERLQGQYQTSVQMIQKWKKMYEDLHQFCVTEVLDGNVPESANGHHVR